MNRWRVFWWKPERPWIPLERGSIVEGRTTTSFLTNHTRAESLDTQSHTTYPPSAHQSFPWESILVIDVVAIHDHAPILARNLRMTSSLILSSKYLLNQWPAWRGSIRSLCCREYFHYHGYWKKLLCPPFRATWTKDRMWYFEVLHCRAETFLVGWFPKALQPGFDSIYDSLVLVAELQPDLPFWVGCLN